VDRREERGIVNMMWTGLRCFVSITAH
jgi:hypothetical protein